MAGPALEHVMNNDIKFYPSKFKNTYKHWMENLRDWCISRQLWWGQQIPAWYDEKGNIYVAETREEAEKQANSGELIQDEDVLDTWFSSWLWPMSVFDGILDPDNEDIKYYYPTNDLITAPDILFFWVARMIMAGYEYKNELPFKNVYLTGMVRDKQRRKMSKSLGNSPEPLELMKKYSADGVRVGMLLCSPAGNDLLFDEALCEQGRNFCNKVWNAFRLVKSWNVDEDAKQPEQNALAVKWFDAKLNSSIDAIEDHFSKYRMSDALMATYKLVWDDFCSWYLEIVKPDFEQPIDGKTHAATIGIFEKLLKLMHPFMPFISEEIWHLISERGDDNCIIVAEWPQAEAYDSELLHSFDLAVEVVTGIRNLRKSKNISHKESLSMVAKGNGSLIRDFDPIISKLANLSEITYSSEKPQNAQAIVIKSNEYFIPLSDAVDVKQESQKLADELDYTKGFLSSIEKKLNNDNFVKNAPAPVVEIERKKCADAQSRIKVLEEQIEILKSS